MSAAKKIPNVLVDKITLMAYALSPHPCAQAIKQNLKIWREQQRVDAWETRHPDRPNKNISMRFVGECEEDGRHLVGYWADSARRDRLFTNIKCPYRVVKVRRGNGQFIKEMRWG